MTDDRSERLVARLDAMNDLLTSEGYGADDIAAAFLDMAVAVNIKAHGPRLCAAELLKNVAAISHLLKEVCSEIAQAQKH